MSGDISIITVKCLKIMKSCFAIKLGIYYDKRLYVIFTLLLSSNVLLSGIFQGPASKEYYDTICDSLKYLLPFYASVLIGWDKRVSLLNYPLFGK